MGELLERLRIELEGIEPSAGALDDTMARVRRRHRGRRIGAAAVGLVLSGSIGVGLWWSAHDGGTAPATTPSPTQSPGPAASGTRLFLAGDGELWIVDVAALQTDRLEMPELGPGDPPHRIVARAGELVAWSYETLVLDPDEPSRPEVLADDSLIFIPSDQRDRVWIGVVDPESPDARLSAVREMTVDGRITVPDVPPPDGMWPVAAVDGNLVFQPRHGELLIWDPRTRTTVETLAGDFVLAWDGPLLAWRTGDGEPIHITDMSNGDDLAVPPPSDVSDLGEGAFSPDQRMLAVEACFGPSCGEVQLALIDVETGDVTLVPGTRARRGYALIGWDAAGSSVFFTNGDRFETRTIAEYRVATGTLRMLDVEVGDFYDMAVL